ncbi:MAG: hypothetical protein B7Y43_16755 [Sphingomonas sp. 28-62-20]|uniref:sensor histidine kinase n=1 Tax=Sphingomonas sp. 28-62-20 TaxID=1970433 RepID=UPI000BD6399F|nr:MAG: hypothetical protein B7Y43_16755 [Sphingomonas sp. 28-62-20]
MPTLFPYPQIRSVRLGRVLFIILFWATQFSLLTANRLMMMPEEGLSFILPRLCVTTLGVALSFAIMWISERFPDKALRTRLLIALACALVGCNLHAAGNFLIFRLFVPRADWLPFEFVSYMVSLISWFWAYLALSGLLLAIAYSVDLSDRERRISELRAIADAAQMRALRYQLNPHFMFNTLNSIAALIARGDPKPAEMMVENLADFLRASLSLDTQEDISFARELELQSLYLAIEAVRFADRFEVRTEVSEAAKAALVPSLVLQPLIENVIKHAVARSTCPITLTISAHVAAGCTHVTIANGPGNCSPPCAGQSTGVGLSNVAHRLATRFGDRASLTAGAHSNGGFAVAFSLPYATA